MDLHKITVVVLLLVITVNISASEAEEYKNNYNENGLQQLLENSEWENDLEHEDIVFWLFWIIKQKKASQTKINEYALQAIDILEENLSSEDGLTKRYYRLTILYNSLITDPPSWLKYHKEKEEYLELCTKSDPEYKDMKILKVRNLLFYPPRGGGDKIKGLADLKTLDSEYPDDTDILVVFGDYYLEKEKFEKAKEYYSRILIQIPNHYHAKSEYDELVLIEKKLTIGSIRIMNQLKTRVSHKMNYIKYYEGQLYSQDNKLAISSLLYSLPSITDIKIESVEMENGTVDINIEVSENNLMIFGLAGEMVIDGKYDNLPYINGFPAVFYIDRNLFGTGNHLRIVFGGIFLGINFTIPERGKFPFDLTFHADALVLPLRKIFIDQGLDTGWGLKTPSYNFSVLLEKNTDLGLSFSTYHNLKINKYTSEASNFTTPENNITYSGNIDLRFSTIHTALPSAFNPPEGFSLSITPAIIFKPDYRSWGPDTSLFTHNDYPEGTLTASIQYYNTILKRFYLGGSLSYYGGINYYESEKWIIGQTDMKTVHPRLSGYLPTEYLSENALIANIEGHFQIIMNRMLVHVKHDIYYDIDENRFRQGSAMGFAFNLPLEIELNIEAGIGWNAVREDNFSWALKIALSRYFIFD